MFMYTRDGAGRTLPTYVHARGRDRRRTEKEKYNAILSQAMYIDI